MPDTIRDENKRNVDRLFEACFNHGEVGLLEELVSPEYVGLQGDRGPAGFKGIVVGLRTAFPDIHYTVEDVVAENDKVAVRWHWTGTHEAPFRTFPASHHKVTSTGRRNLPVSRRQDRHRDAGDRSPRVSPAGGRGATGRGAERPSAPSTVAAGC